MIDVILATVTECMTDFQMMNDKFWQWSYSNISTNPVYAVNSEHTNA